MIGTRVASRPPSPRAALLVVAFAIALGGLGAGTRTTVLVILAVLPLAIGACLLFAGERRFRARFTPLAMEVAHPAQSIPYARIVEVRPIAPVGAPLPREFAIDVVHEDGHVVLPAALTTGSERVHSFLRGFIRDAPRPLPAALDEYRRAQEQAFGPEKVWSYGPRRGPLRGRSPRTQAVGAGIGVAAVAWIAAGLARSEVGWTITGAIALVIGALALAFEKAGRGHPAVRAEDAAETGLVVSPVGLAMNARGLSGHIAWAQVRDVAVRAAPRWILGQGTRPGIALEVEGATILVEDLYDRPLGEIHDRIRRYWN